MASSLIGSLTKRSFENTAVPIASSTIAALFSDQPLETGVSVTEETSMQQSAVWRSVNILAGLTASLPLHIYNKSDNTRVQGIDLFESLHPTLTNYELMELLMLHLLLWGNAYLLIREDKNGQPTALEPIHPGRVRLQREPTPDDLSWVKTFWVQGVDGKQAIPMSEDKIMHVTGISFDGVQGVSPIRWAKQMLALNGSAERYGGRLFSHGTLIDGILTADSELTEEVARRYQQQWAASHTGMLNSHQVAVMGNGMKWQSVALPPEDAQFLQTRQFGINEIARLFGVPVHLLQQVDRTTSWGRGIESQNMAMLTYTLQPYLARVEKRFTRDILARFNPNAYAQFDSSELLRADSLTRFQGYHASVGVPWMTINEARSMENLLPVDQGDELYLPVAYGDIDFIAEGKNAGVSSGMILDELGTQDSIDNAELDTGLGMDDNGTEGNNPKAAAKGK